MNTKRIFILFFIVFFAGSAIVFGQEGESGEPHKQLQMEDVTGVTTGNVTMDFKEADITNVLRILSYKSGINIVAGRDVSGPITIRLTDVPWEKALDVILRTYGYIYEREGNIIRVTTTENLAKEELITEVFSLNYADAKTVPSAIEDMLSERGSIKYDERANLIIVTDIPTNIYKIKQVIDKIDTRTKQVNIEAKIIETTLDKDDKLGINWTMQIAATGAARPLTFPFSKHSGGGTWFPNGDTSASAGDNIGAFPANPGAGFPLALPKNFTLGTLDFTALQAVLQMLKTKTDSKIISNPRITTLDNQEAKIVVATTFSIPTYERNSSTGNIEVTGYEEKELGITLSVTPHINPENYIIVKLEPEVTTFITWDTFTSGGSGSIQAPRFSTRRASTQVMVKDGETIVIGGLIKEEVIDTIVKVPILGDIPILSLLFKRKEKAIDTTDLLFFITVNIVKPGSTATAAIK